MSKKAKERMGGAGTAIVASVFCLVAVAALLILLYTGTLFVPLLQTAILLLLPVAINILLILLRPAKRGAAPAEAPTVATDETEKPALSPRKRAGARFCKLCRLVGETIAKKRVLLSALLIVALLVVANVFFWRYVRETSFANLLAAYHPVIMGGLFVLFIVFGKWCKHATPALSEESATEARYDLSLSRNLQSAFALGRVAAVLLALAMVIYLFGWYDTTKWLVILLSLLFAYEVIFMVISLFVVLVRRELTTAPEVTAPMPGVEGGDLGILTYLEKNTGITMRSLWSMQLLRRSLPYAALLAVLLLWSATGISLVGSHQEGAHYRFGRLQEETLSPGLHFTLPWPLDRVEVYDTKTVNTMTIGYIATGDADNLWTESHGSEEYRLLLGGGNELVSINLRVMYRISDLRAYISNSASPELLMSSAAYEIVTARTITSDLDTMLSTDRAAFASTFRDELTARLAPYGTGLEITSVVLESIHPPVEIADAYQALISAEIQADQMILNAESYAAQTVAFAYVEYDDSVSGARIAHHNNVANANAAVAEFLAAVAADTAYYCPEDGCLTLLEKNGQTDKYSCPKCHTEHDAANLTSASAEYRYYKYIKALTAAYSGAKLIIVGDGVNTENLYIGNIPGGN